MRIPFRAPIDRGEFAALSLPIIWLMERMDILADLLKDKTSSLSCSSSALFAVRKRDGVGILCVGKQRGSAHCDWPAQSTEATDNPEVCPQSIHARREGILAIGATQTPTYC